MARLADHQFVSSPYNISRDVDKMKGRRNTNFFYFILKENGRCGSKLLKAIERYVEPGRIKGLLVKAEKIKEKICTNADF